MANYDLSHCDNLNLLWAKLLIEEAVRLGIRDFCIAPGSRSTPLTLAVAEHPRAQSYCHFDERGLGFFALGLAKATKRCVALITTSGTAVANLYPAIIEAKQTGVPLLVLSADRPIELLNTGANQAIIQANIFADYPVYQSQLPAPSSHIAPQLLLSELDQALAAQQRQAGPVHLNCPYREPFYPKQGEPIATNYLAPLATWLNDVRPYTQWPETHHVISPANNWHDDKRTVVVLGKLDCPQQTQAIVTWARVQQLPLLADVQAQSHNMAEVINQAELILKHEVWPAQLSAERIIQFGGLLVGKNLQQWLSQQAAEYWYIDPLPLRYDPSLKLDMQWQCSHAAWLKAHAPKSPSAQQQAYDALWQKAASQLDGICASALQDYSELSAISHIAKAQSEDAQLFISNSMPIRLFELLAPPCLAARYYANRGASGIDGIIASAAGVASAKQGATSLIIGDTSALHDVNSLSLAKHANLRVFVFNNDGGEIFKLLPPVSEQHAARYYQMPHGYDFAGAARMFNLPYVAVHNLAELDQALSDNSLAHACLIELHFAPGDSSARFANLIKHYRSHATH